MRLKDFDYPLPPQRIAQHPPEKRGDSRLMVVDRKNGNLEHRFFSQLPEYLQSGDVLVVNDTRVLPARLIGRKESGGKVEILLVRKRENPGAGPIPRNGNVWPRAPEVAGPKTPVLLDPAIQGQLRGEDPGGLVEAIPPGQGRRGPGSFSAAHRFCPPSSLHPSQRRWGHAEPGTWTIPDRLRPKRRGHRRPDRGLTFYREDSWKRSGGKECGRSP